MTNADHESLAPLTKLASVRNLLKKGVRPVPNADARAKTRTHISGDVADEEGRTAVSRLHGPETGVNWTTMTSLAVSRNALNGSAPSGYQTPAMAYGADFVLGESGVTRKDGV